MSISDRENAMAALRAWAAPGARARLVATCWDLGERNISALADAAGVSRGTVYTDLADRGIYPSPEQRKETPTVKTIEIDGMVGDQTDDGKLHPDLLFADLEKAGKSVYDHNAPPLDGRPRLSGDFHTLLDRRLAAHTVVRWHNGLSGKAAGVLHAHQQGRRALDLVKHRWDALRTARAWLAAHHQYIEAVHAAREALTTWTRAEEEYARLANRFAGLNDRAQALYEEQVPEDERIPAPDSDTPATLLMALEEQHKARKAIAAETLPFTAESGG